MFSIPLYIVLFLYSLFLAVVAAFMLIHLYHIVATASFTLVSFMMTFFIFASTALVLYFTMEFLSAAAINWQAPLILFDIDWFRSLFGNQSFS